MADCVDYLVGETDVVERLAAAAPDVPFSAATIDFLHALHQEIARDTRAREFPDVATFGFFCRRANMLVLREKQRADLSIRVGRGLVFHVAPSNVPVNFAYSLVCGLLAGNANIVRVPSRDFEQVRIIKDAILRVTAGPQYRPVGERIVLVRYERTSDATALFSSLCDARVIWGGDATVQDIRKAPMPARSHEVTFSDRFSFGVINALPFLANGAPEKIADDFYNDTYLFDQNACTAPHLLLWLGSAENVGAAKEKFWQSMHEVVCARYREIEAVVAVDKLAMFCLQAVEFAGTRRGWGADNRVWRAELGRLPRGIEEFRCGGGYFSEYHAASLAAIPAIVSRKYQTMAYYGIPKAELEAFIRSSPMLGIDRVVPIGRTLDFSLKWDGYDLIAEFSRIVEVR